MLMIGFIHERKWLMDEKEKRTRLSMSCDSFSCVFPKVRKRNISRFPIKSKWRDFSENSPHPLWRIECFQVMSSFLNKGSSQIDQNHESHIHGVLCVLLTIYLYWLMVWEMNWWSVMRMFIWHTMPSEWFLPLCHCVFSIAEWIGKRIYAQNTLPSHMAANEHDVTRHNQNPITEQQETMCLCDLLMIADMDSKSWLDLTISTQVHLCHHKHSGVKCMSSKVKWLGTVVWRYTNKRTHDKHGIDTINTTAT